MLLTLHNYKEKKNTLTFVRYELMTFFSTMSFFYCKKGVGRLKSPQTSNLPRLDSRSLFTAFDYRASQQVVPNFCPDKNREINMFQ